MEINGRTVGRGHPVYVIAEMSANHNQSFDTAVQIIEEAKRAGADAVKLQTFTADTMTIDSDKEYFQIKGTQWEGRTLYDLYSEAHMPWEWYTELKGVALNLDIDLFSTPFDDTAVDFLEDLGVPAYKIASFENVDLPLLRRVAATGKPVIMSTGMATLAELNEAVATLRAGGTEQLALLKCTSAYPAPPESMNLCTIRHLSDTFGVVAGLSDHTEGIAVPVVAVAMGACVIEKHLTLSREEGGLDSAFSLEPNEFATMVDAVRTAKLAGGVVHYGLTGDEEQSRAFRRSLFVVRDVRRGERFTEASVRSIRPGHGLHTRHFDSILGRHAARDIERGTPLSWELVA